MRTAFVLPFLLPAAHAQLNTLAVAAGLKYFGSATDNVELSDAPYVAVLSDVSEFGQITPGNAQKWDSVEKSQQTFTFDKGDEIIALASNNNQIVKCHTLVWYSQLPSWVSQLSNSTVETVMRNHILQTVTHFRGQCYSWDVVNEAFDDTDAAAHRDNPFFKAMGEDYIRIAFETAASADPGAVLYYNDYNIEYTGPKQAACLALITKLVGAGVPITGVSAQGHYISGKMPSVNDISTNLKQYTALGVEVAMTELDIRMSLPVTNASLAQQAQDFADATQACLEAHCVGITIWDYTDKYSWIPKHFSGMGAPLLWDENLNKKPAYYAVAETLKTAGSGYVPTY